jgi:hypothetical protein
MGGIKPRNSCRSLFKGLEIICLPCVYIFSLMNLSLNNQEHFQTNPAVHSVNTQNKHYLHRPIDSLSCFQKCMYYIGIKIFHSLPFSLKSLLNEEALFRVALKRYINTHSFYSVDEFLMCESNLQKSISGQYWCIYVNLFKTFEYHMWTLCVFLCEIFETGAVVIMNIHVFCFMTYCTSYSPF